MIAIFELIIIGLAFGLGYWIGRTGKGDQKASAQAAAEARQQLEDQILSAGYGEIVVENGERKFRLKQPS